MSQTNSYLTLCIEERSDMDYNQIDNRLFIAYDSEQETYVVYGKCNAVAVDCQPYFFRADRSCDMYKFVKFVIGKETVCSYTLYNYNNMPYDLEEVDYYFMEENMDIRYDIATYDRVRLSKREFRKNLKMLKNVYNFY
jgi:hypothetical protein